MFIEKRVKEIRDILSKAQDLNESLQNENWDMKWIFNLEERLEKELETLYIFLAGQPTAEEITTAIEKLRGGYHKVKVLENNTFTVEFVDPHPYHCGGVVKVLKDLSAQDLIYLTRDK